MDEELKTVTVTCRTPGCENADVPITLEVPVDVSRVYCGACSTIAGDVEP